MKSSAEQTSISNLASVSKALLISARPKQWTKNLLVYFALFFTVSKLWDPSEISRSLSLVSNTTMAFILFSALSSAIYIANDILDKENDRFHPKKRLRPIASGALPTSLGWSTAAILATLSLILSFFIEPLFGWIALGYSVLMIGYSTLLKRVVLLDVFSISGGFVLRAMSGAAVLQVPISPWLYTCTGLGALLIALVKRRSELTVSGDTAGAQRDTLNWYTTSLLDQFIAVVAPSTLLAYTLYTFTAPNLPDNHAMMLTIPFVVYALFRYMFLVHTKGLGENPEDILISDVPLIISILIWLAVAVTILTIFR